MKTKIIFMVLVAVSVAFFGFSQLKKQSPVPKCFTNYTLTLAEIGPLTSGNNYIVDDNNYNSYFSGSFAQGTNVTIQAASAIQGENGADYYFFRKWSDNVTTNPRVVTMNSDIYLAPIYKNKQGVQWVPGGLE